MNKWIKIATPILLVSVLSLFAWGWIKYLQQRPWPPEITSPGKTIESGDTYTLTWMPATEGPQPEFYYLEKSSDQSFSTPIRITIPHKSQTTQQAFGPIIAAAVPKPKKEYYYRVLAGYKSKYFSPKDILSDPSNVVTFTIKHLSASAIMPTFSTVFSGQEYSLNWTSINKANAYLLEEKKSYGATKEYKLTTTSKSFVVPPLKQDGMLSYKVKAAIASGTNWVNITDWSNQESITVKHVEAPPNLKIDPKSVYNPNKYKVSWDMPPNGPMPISSYSYVLRETKPFLAPNLLPSQSLSYYSATAPSVSSSTTIDYEVMAYYGKNPMTLFSPLAKVTIKPPPPPPPPQITTVDPKIAPKGDTVTINGNNLSGAKVELYSSTTKKLVTPTSQTTSKIVFKVPIGVSLKTTTVQVIAGNNKDQKPFQVARQSGNFVERQGTLKLIPHSCSQFKAEIDLPPNYLNNFTGRFKDGSTILVNFPLPGFKGTNIVKSGLGFSQKCKIGVLVAETKAGLVQPAYINFYNLNHKQDSITNPGDKISGPNGIEPSVFFVEGYKLLFSPDETIVAVITRNKLGPSKLWIYVIDMLTGKNIYGNGFNNLPFSLSIDKTNKISFTPSGAQEILISIPIP